MPPKLDGTSLNGFPHVAFVAETPSTNTEAMTQALMRMRHGAPLPLWVVAQRQTAGRGRSGRSWVSQPGNFHGSVAFAVGCDAMTAAQVSLLAGVAAIDAIRALARHVEVPKLRLKWPNDVLVDGKKVGGILVESSSTVIASGVRRILVVGFGINLSCHPDEMGGQATHLGAHGLQLGPPELQASLSTALHTWLHVWGEGENFKAVREAWLERAGPLGERLSVDSGQQRLNGRFKGLDGSGALLLEMASGEARTITFGDVSIGSTDGEPKTG